MWVSAREGRERERERERERMNNRRRRQEKWRELMVFFFKKRINNF